MTVTLVRYDAAKRALAAASRVDEAKNIRDRAEAVRVYALQAKDFDLQNRAATIRLMAERRAGQLLIDMTKNPGTRGSGRPRKDGTSKRRYAKATAIPPTLEELNISKVQSSKWQRLARLVDDDTFEEALNRAKDVFGELTTAGVLRMVKQVVKPQTTVVEPEINVIAADLIREFESANQRERLDKVIRLRSRLNPTLRKKLIVALDNAAKYATASSWKLSADMPVFPAEYPITTASMGNNSELFSDILNLYVPPGTKILDATYGLGNFWKKANRTEFTVITNDLHTAGTDHKCDFRKLPFADASFGAFVFDPPYSHGGTSMKESLSVPYGCDRCEATSESEIIQMYIDGAKEALRVVESGGIFIVKTQDAIESGRLVPKHIILSTEFVKLGFELVNIHVLVQTRQPTMRHTYQYNARQNHSYFMIFRRANRKSSRNASVRLATSTHSFAADFKQPPSNGKAHQRLIREHMATQPEADLEEKLRLAADFKSATVREITYDEAKNVILANEWLGNMGTTEWTYGLFFGKYLAGVACFGSTAGTNVASSICGAEHRHKVTTLCRGACVHWAHHHSASFLISTACKEMTKKGYHIFVAYADPGQVSLEIGTVYQAAGWAYIGPSSPTEQFRTPDGKIHDSRQVSGLARDRRGGVLRYKRTRAQQKQLLIEQGCEFFEGAAKHRYVGIYGDRRTKRMLKAALRWPVLPYPKRPTVEEPVQAESA